MAIVPPLVTPTRRILALAVVTALITGTGAVGGAVLLGIPLRDPDGFLGPSWVRMPLLIGACLVIDVVPRILWRARAPEMWGSVLPLARQVLVERWAWHRLVPIIVAVTSFYVTYVGYRNLKNFLPFVFDRSEDLALVTLDRTLAFGHTPAELLHTLLGTGVSAYVLSGVYMAYLFFVPISVVVALIWSKDLVHGLWYVTALCLNWFLGTVSYYLIPASGPFYRLPWHFADIPATGATALQASLLRNRAAVMVDPTLTSQVSGVAAFASLHVSVVFTAALIVHLSGVSRLVKHAMWGYFVLVVISTIYFGWHYLVDDVAGVAIGFLSVWLGAMATGHLRPDRRSRVPVGRERASVTAD